MADWQPRAELFVPNGVGGCNIEHLRLSRSGTWLVTERCSGQGEWGYDVIRVDPLVREGGIDSKRGYMHEAPAFDDTESRVIGGYGLKWLGGWWSHPDDDVEVPARGGRVTFGWLFVHRLPSHEVTWHELVMDIPRGYLPADPWSDACAGPHEIHPHGEGVQLVLPGGRAVDIDAPLPSRIELPVPAI